MEPSGAWRTAGDNAGCLRPEAGRDGVSSRVCLLKRGYKIDGRIGKLTTVTVEQLKLCISTKNRKRKQKIQETASFNGQGYRTSGTIK